MKDGFIGVYSLITGTLLLGLGLALGKSSARSSRHRHSRVHVRRRSGWNPGSSGRRRRKLEYEMLAMIREQRALIADIRNPKFAHVDAEFIVEPPVEPPNVDPSKGEV